ncbi:MAG: carbohydrate kinase family protein [Acidobacteria bacterium]|nr:carbohydrate kinase family protein [Acidobacteriota bacterium]
MPSVDLLCVGESFDDLIFLDLDRLPRAGEEIRTDRCVGTIGGGAVITAVAAARLGLRARIVSALSAPAAARLRTEGVGVVNLRRPAEAHAISAALSTRRNRSLVTFTGVNDRLETRLFAMRRRLRAPYVHFAFTPRDCRRWAAHVRQLRARGAITSWDFGWNDRLVRAPGFRELLASLDYVFVNTQEALLYARARTFSTAIARWRRLASQTVIKLGPSGSRWIARDRDLRAPVRRRAAVDTTGAGDAFNGGFLAALARGLTPRECLRLANAVGAASTQHAGGLPMTRSATVIRSATLSGSRSFR